MRPDRSQARLCAAVSAGFALVLAVGGCSSGSASGPGTPSSTGGFVSGSPSSQTPCGLRPTAPAYEHVVWIVMENHGSDQLVGSSSAPYFNSIIGKCGLATNFHAETHPSLPNYIAMTSGGTQGIDNDDPPADHPLNVPSIFSQLGAGRWRSLAESMPSNCSKDDAGTYAVRHNPPTYYVNIADQCARQSVPLADPPDLSAPFTFVVPNLRSDSHDTEIGYGDAWLAKFVPKVLDSPQYRSGNTAVVITYDEDEDEGGQNTIPTVVISPSTGIATKNDTYFTHYSLLRTTEDLLGLAPLGQASDAASMRSAFNL